MLNHSYSVPFIKANLVLFLWPDILRVYQTSFLQVIMHSHYLHKQEVYYIFWSDLDRNVPDIHWIKTEYDLAFSQKLHYKSLNPSNQKMSLANISTYHSTYLLTWWINFAATNCCEITVNCSLIFVISTAKTDHVQL